MSVSASAAATSSLAAEVDSAPHSPQCHSPADPQRDDNYDKTDGYVPNMKYFLSAIGIVCGPSCQGQKGCTSFTGTTLKKGQTTAVNGHFSCEMAQHNNSALNCEPPDWEASAIKFNFGLKLRDPHCVWVVDQERCRNDFYNSLTSCPAGSLDWNKCVAWTIGAGAAELSLSDWSNLDIPPD